MSTLTDTLLREHAALLEGVERIRLAARDIPALSPAERETRRAEVVDFLRDTVVPHARHEERDVYPRVARVLGHPESTSSMVYDHLAVRERTADLTDADPDDVPRLQELLYGLYAVIRTHPWKEEELYFPLLEQGGRPPLAEVAYETPVLRHEP